MFFLTLSLVFYFFLKKKNLTKQDMAKFRDLTIFIFKSIDMCAQVLIIDSTYHSKAVFSLSPLNIRQQLSVDLIYLFVFSSRRSASRLICRIASSSTTTRALPSVITVGACCGVSTGRALNVKVNPIFCLYRVTSALFLPSILPLIFYCFIEFSSSGSLIHLSHF